MHREEPCAPGQQVARPVAGGSRGAVIWGGTIALALGVLYLPVFIHAVTVWFLDGEFSFGFLVPPITLGLLWQRRQALRAARGVGSAAGLFPLVGGLFLLVASARSGVHALGGISFIVTVLGALTYLYGRPVTRLALFPLTFLAFGLCLYRGLLSGVGFTMQGLTAHYAAIAATLVGVPVQRNGVDLYVGHFHFVVADACSGMRPLLALLFLGTLVIGLSELSWLRRVTLLALIGPIVLFSNITRVALVLVLARTFGLEVAHGFIHGAFSATLFLVALSLFFLIGRIAQWAPPWHRDVMQWSSV